MAHVTVIHKKHGEVIRVGQGVVLGRKRSLSWRCYTLETPQAERRWEEGDDLGWQGEAGVPGTGQTHGVQSWGLAWEPEPWVLVKCWLCFAGGGARVTSLPSKMGMWG